MSYDGSPRHITVIAAEQLSVQFDSPEDALAWLAWCADHVREALRAQGGSPEPTNEDSLKAEVLDLQARLDHDHEADPDDVPVLPDLVALALSVLLRSVDVPGSVSRPHTCEAAAIVRGHFRVGADDAPVHGYPRPVTA